MTENLFFLNYTNGIDYITIVLAIIVIFFIKSTYVADQVEIRLLKIADVAVMLAAFLNVLFHKLLNIENVPITVLYITHHLVYILLIFTYAIFVVYLSLLLKIKKNLKYISWATVGIIFVTFCIFEIMTNWLHIGFYIDSNRTFHDGYYDDPFRWAYIAMTIEVMSVVIYHKKMFVTKMFWCLISVISLLYLVAIIEDFYRTTEYICFTFVVPIITILFLYHYNSFDKNTGTLDYNAFKGYLDEEKDTEFFMICLELPKVDDIKINEMGQYFYHFNEAYFKKPLTFRISDKFIMLTKYSSDIINDETKKNVLSDFEKLYQKYQLDYKLIFMKSDKELTGADEYLRFYESCINHIPLNSFHQIDEDEIKKFMKERKVLSLLNEINQKKNLTDERVLVYCQPVLDVNKQKYTTAEALMRLKSNDDSMIFPDQFIHLAENNGCIHVLSEIILNKVCKEIKSLIEEGYNFERISINISTLELRDKNFCNDIISIIGRHGIPYDKIAIELTESKNEKDFEIVQSVMDILRSKGITFYLDDFGTGYSNIERILKLPIDIIKFDRSLTISSGVDGNSRMVVGSFASIFKKTNYGILFEGVEDDKDEQRCIEMYASFLQGYKYSKPIPITQLREYFEKK